MPASGGQAKGVAKAGNAAASRSSWRDQATALALATAALIVYRNSLDYFFAQDAFTLLARVRGLVPSVGGLWRPLSGEGYFRAMDLLFGLDPRPYHGVTLALHALDVVLAFFLARRVGLSRASAALAASFFAGHGALFDAIFAITGVGELMSAAWIMAALLVALPGRKEQAAKPWRAAVVALCYAAALLSKESVVLFPVLLAWVVRFWPNGARRALWPCAILAALYLASFWAGDPFGMRIEGPSRNPYRPLWGGELLRVWASYAAWTMHTVYGLRLDLSDVVAAHPGGWMATSAGLIAIATLWRNARVHDRAGDARRGPTADAFRAAALGGVFYTIFLAPVLPLGGHAYHYYLYVPLVGLAWIPAAACDAWLPRSLRPAVWLTSGCLLLNGFVLARVMERSTLAGSDMRTFGVVQRPLLAKRVLEGLGEGEAPLPEEVSFVGPHALNPASRADTTWLARYAFTNLRAALDEGRGVQVFFPQVRYVRFFRDLDSSLTQPDVFVLDYQGGLQRGPAALLYLKRTEVAWKSGMAAQALDSAVRAEAMARRWALQVPAGSWRGRGAASIRHEAASVLAAMGAAPHADPEWQEVRRKLANLAGGER